ncbi:MAG TPA: LCP family protein [Pseudonocardiaceae bacterium]
MAHRSRHSRARGRRATTGLCTVQDLLATDGVGERCGTDEDRDPDLTERIPLVSDTLATGADPRGERRADRVRRLLRALVVARRALVGMLALVVLAGTGYGWASLNNLQSNLNTTDVITAPPAGAPGDGATDILLVGSDSRTDANGNPLPLEVLKLLRTEESAGLNTDTIILVRVPDNGGNAYAVSIPRDTYVPIPGYREDKINVTYGMSKRFARERLRREGVTDEHALERQANEAGQRILVQTVEELTGVKIDHYAEINLFGFYLLTQAIGGVEVCLKRATRDPDSGADFRKGRQLVSAGDALAFVRQRKGLPRGDLDRIVRQQVFMAALANRMLAAGTLADPGKLSALVDAVQRSIVLDDGWDVLAFAGQLQGIAAGDVQFVTIPVAEVGARNDRGQSVITVDRAEVHAFVAGLLGDDRVTTPSTPSTPSSSPRGTTATAPAVDTSSVVVSVFNASTRGGLASRVMDVLARAGYRIGQTDNAPRRLDRSRIVVAAGARPVGEQIAAALGRSAEVVEDPALNPDRVKVYLGADYIGPGAHAMAGRPLVHLDGPAVLRGQPTPSLTPAPTAAPTPAPTPASADDDAPITAEGVTCVN